MEAVVFDRLQAYLRKLDADAALIDPARAPLQAVIRSHQSGPRPAGAYASINILSEIDLGEVDGRFYSTITLPDENDDPEERVVFTAARAMAWLIQVNVFAKNGTDYCRLFTAALKSEFASVDLAPLVVREIADVTRAPELVQERWEGRALFNVTLAGIVLNQMLVDVVDQGSVLITGKVGNVAVTEEIADYSRG